MAPGAASARTTTLIDRGPPVSGGSRAGSGRYFPNTGPRSAKGGGRSARRRAARWLGGAALGLALLGAATACDDEAGPAEAFHTAPLERPATPGPGVLHRAARSGDLAAVRAALAQGADPDARDSHGRTALHAYFSKHNWQLQPELLEALLAAGADAGARDAAGITVLQAAAERSRPEAIERLLRAGAELEATDSRGRTALHHAAKAGQLRNTASLLAAGAEPDPIDEEGRSPLHAAAAERHWDSALALIRAGADPSRGDGYGDTPLAWLTGRCLDELSRAGDEAGGKAACLRIAALLGPCLHRAAADGRLAAAVRLLARGADPAERYAFLPGEGSAGNALHAAARSGHVDLVRTLLDAGMAVDSRTANGWTALHLAAWAGRREIVELLLGRGAAPTARTRAGQTAAALAARRGDDSLVKRLTVDGGP
jgi:ankyrin repeat protein